MKKVKNTKKRSLSRSWFLITKISAFCLLIVVALAAVTLFSYQLAYRGRIYPGIKIAGINVGNRTPDEAKADLTVALTRLQNEGINFTINGETKKLSLSDLGIGYDSDQAVSVAFLIGRQANLIAAIYERVQAWNQAYYLSPIYHFDNQKLRAALDSFDQKVAKPLVQAAFHVQGGNVVVTPPKTGQQLDYQDAQNQLTSKLASFATGPVPLTVKTLVPNVSAAEADSLKDRVTAILAHPLKLTFQDKSWEIKDDQLAGLISFAPPETQASLAVNLGKRNLGIENLALPFSPSPKSQLSIDPDNLSRLITSLAKTINQEPVEARFVFNNSKVTTFQSSQDGYKLDSNDTTAQINNVLFTNFDPNNNPHIALKVTVTKPKVTNDSVNSLGIKELIGQGTSTFFHSIPNRATNIALAASKINGTLVPPGEVFSMSDTVGEVDGSTGYKEAYIISKGRTQLDFGGGVCQVSTTMFRAALDSGLPIIERHPHAYRVGYYEQDAPVGIDASVYFPNVDFRFKNDTANYILIQTLFDGAASRLTFNFYGSKDGRVVTQTKPVITSQTPPLPDLNQDDPTLPAGMVKQVDFSAWGATVYFNRTVTRNGEVLAKDTFYSNYQPWQAIFLHGTKVG